MSAIDSAAKLAGVGEASAAASDAAKTASAVGETAKAVNTVDKAVEAGQSANEARNLTENLNGLSSGLESEHRLEAGEHLNSAEAKEALSADAEGFAATAKEFGNGFEAGAIENVATTVPDLAKSLEAQVHGTDARLSILNAEIAEAHNTFSTRIEDIYNEQNTIEFAEPGEIDINSLQSANPVEDFGTEGVADAVNAQENLFNAEKDGDNTTSQSGAQEKSSNFENNSQSDNTNSENTSSAEEGEIVYHQGEWLASDIADATKEALLADSPEKANEILEKIVSEPLTEQEKEQFRQSSNNYRKARSNWTDEQFEAHKTRYYQPQSGEVFTINNQDIQSFSERIKNNEISDEQKEALKLLLRVAIKASAKGAASLARNIAKDKDTPAELRILAGTFADFAEQGGNFADGLIAGDPKADLKSDVIDFIHGKFNGGGNSENLGSTSRTSFTSRRTSQRASGFAGRSSSTAGGGERASNSNTSEFSSARSGASTSSRASSGGFESSAGGFSSGSSGRSTAETTVNADVKSADDVEKQNAEQLQVAAVAGEQSDINVESESANLTAEQQQAAENLKRFFAQEKAKAKEEYEAATKKTSEFFDNQDPNVVKEIRDRKREIALLNGEGKYETGSEEAYLESQGLSGDFAVTEADANSYFISKASAERFLQNEQDVSQKDFDAFHAAQQTLQSVENADLESIRAHVRDKAQQGGRTVEKHSGDFEIKSPELVREYYLKQEAVAAAERAAVSQQQPTETATDVQVENVSSIVSAEDVNSDGGEFNSASSEVAVQSVEPNESSGKVTSADVNTVESVSSEAVVEKPAPKESPSKADSSNSGGSSTSSTTDSS